MLIAREAGFESWTAFEEALREGDPLPAGSATIVPAPQRDEAGPGMIMPVAMRTTFRVKPQDGVYSTTTEEWDMLTACRDGNLERVNELMSRCPSLVHCEYNMANGVNPNHMNCHHTTLLHDMAQEGDLQKARLLLAHGADINAVDEEFQSTPLGLAARWGQRDMVTFLLERGADPNTSGAQWATPLAWARKKGRAGIELDLRQAGGR